MDNSNQSPSPESENLRLQLDHIRNELNILYQISNAMRTTLKLDEVLYIILTGVTAHDALGFNRAALFLVDEPKKTIEGRIGIGPDTGEEADKIWQAIEKDKMSLEDLIRNFRERKITEPKWHNIISSFKLSCSEEAGIIFEVIVDKMPLHLKKEHTSIMRNDPLIQLFGTEEMVLVPLLAKEKTIGLIAADNFITKKAISNEEIRLLSMFANQAGLAIENSKLYENILSQAQRDSLTGLYNHGYFQDTLQKMVEMKTPLTLLMIDIDNFKKYNDAHGHQAGDTVLRNIASVITSSARKEDIIARYGGEEFTAILPQTDKNGGFIIAERTRKNIENANLTSEDIPDHYRIMVSIGIASSPQDTINKEELIKFADQALYKAKHEGKNKVCSYIPSI